MDGSMRFEERSFCGINEDNIYTFYVNPLAEDIRKASQPKPHEPDVGPGDREDSYVVHDGVGGVRIPPGRGPR
jgi:hypothetical protein